MYCVSIVYVLNYNTTKYRLNTYCNTYHNTCQIQSESIGMYYNTYQYIPACISMYWVVKFSFLGVQVTVTVKTQSLTNLSFFQKKNVFSEKTFFSEKTDLTEKTWKAEKTRSSFFRACSMVAGCRVGPQFPLPVTMTTQSKLHGQKKEAASSFCAFAPVESFLVAKVSI